MFRQIDRPPRNRRKLGDEDLDWDQDIEDALFDTIFNGKAIVLPLWQFHSSPAKGRLWSRGFRVHHRVLADRQTVAAWIEKVMTPDDLIAEHNQLKDWVAGETKRFNEHLAPHKERMEEIENKLLEVLNEQKLDNIGSKHGTAYISNILNLKVVDREQFLDLCNEQWDNFGNEALLISAQKDAIKTWMESHDGAPPPGVETSYYRRVNIRRS